MQQEGQEIDPSRSKGRTSFKVGGKPNYSGRGGIHELQYSFQCRMAQGGDYETLMENQYEAEPNIDASANGGISLDSMESALESVGSNSDDAEANRDEVEFANIKYVKDDRDVTVPYVDNVDDDNIVNTLAESHK